MRKIFIADAHLQQPGDENYRRLLCFLGELEGNLETLFILGDFFEFWIGYPTARFPQYLPVLDGLRRLTERGTRLVYFEGNHDFHLGPYFRETLQAEIHPGPAVLSLDGRRLYLCHGDQMDRQDYGYRLLRWVLHSAFTRALTAVVPPAAAGGIADWLSRTSRGKCQDPRHAEDRLRVPRAFAAERFAIGDDVVVTGHFHAPLLERPPQFPGKTLVCLGDWISQFSYAEWQDGDVALRTYS